MKNELPGISYDICPHCGETAEVDPEKTDFRTITLFCVNCKAEGTANRASLAESQPVWKKPKNLEVYREAPAGKLLIRAGFDKKTGLCWVRLSGPKAELLPSIAADPAVKDRIENLLEHHLAEAY